MFRLVIAVFAARAAAQVRPASMNIDAYSKSKPALGAFPGDEAAMLKALEDYPTAGDDVRSDGTEIKPGDADWDNYNYYSRLVDAAAELGHAKVLAIALARGGHPHGEGGAAEGPKTEKMWLEGGSQAEHWKRVPHLDGEVKVTDPDDIVNGDAPGMVSHIIDKKFLPLTYAVRVLSQSRAECVRLLLEAGADPDAGGGVMAPLQKKEGYDPAYSAAVNISSCTTGLLIPPSSTFIVFSLISGGTSVAALFVAGYVPGILMGVGIMIVAGIIAKKRGYPTQPRPTAGEFVRKGLDALLPLGLIVVVMGGIIGGIFTATEASAIAVVYTLLLAFVWYRETSLKQLPSIILESAITTAVVLLMIGCSIAMSRAMAFGNIPNMISDFMLGLSDNPIMILLILNVVLLVVGTFMDMTPALLIFTPILMPVVQQLGMDPVQFGVMMTLNLCVGICTPPVGSALFIGCSVGDTTIPKVIKPLIPFFLTLIAVLMLVTYVPAISLGLPRLLLGYGG